MKKFFFLSMILFIFAGCKYEPKELKVLRGEESSQNTSVIAVTDKKEKNGTVDTAALKINESNNALKEKEIENSLEMEKLKANSKIELAKIEAQREKSVKELETKNSVQIATINKELSIENQKIQIDMEKRRLAFMKIALSVLAVIIIFALIIFYFIHKKKHEIKLKLQEENAKKEKEMQMQEHHHQRVSKILDIISNQKLSPESEKEMIGVLKESTKTTKIIQSSPENKKLIVKK